MLVVSRFSVPESDAGSFSADASAALSAFAGRPGFERGRVGRAVDDPGTWVVVTSWARLGDYRRALSAYEVKLHGAPLLARAVPEASAFEVLLDVPAPSAPGGPSARGSDRAADADSVGVGEAAGPATSADAPSA